MKTVFVLGAGPAGLFAARKLAEAGHDVVIFNRDIKPGGLAEYGIYPTKDKMKAGLRKQFAKILAMPNVLYFGHVTVGSDAGAAISLDTLRSWNPSAIVVAVGAQGTKLLGVPGEDAAGVYAAKDFVYHYNRLPPYAAQEFSIGRRVVIVGMGNVMVDVARWLLCDDPGHRAEEVIVLARRGPFEAKFERHEFAQIEKHLDLHLFEEELRRIESRMASGQDIAKVAEATFPVLTKRYRLILPRLRFRFMRSLAAVHSDENGRVMKITVNKNRLVATDWGIATHATGETGEINCDTVIAAIGDVVDPHLGLPVGNRGGYQTIPDTTYEATPDTFVVGWARKASEGLVGTTRMEAERGAALALRYLQHIPNVATASPAEIAARLSAAGVSVVAKEDLPLLERAEAREAETRGVAGFTFSDDAAMIAAIAAHQHGELRFAAGHPSASEGKTCS